MRGAADRKRVGVTAVALGPTLLILAIGLHQLDAPAHASPCWILPNGLSLNVPGTRNCPIPDGAMVTAVITSNGREALTAAGSTAWRRIRAGGSTRLEVMRDGRRARVDLSVRRLPRSERSARWIVAIVLGAGILAIPLVLLWTSDAAAAPPIAIGYGLVAAVAAALSIDRTAPGVTQGTLLVACAGPFILMHLALVFPRERPAIRAAPGLLRLLYVPLLGVVPLAVLALEAEPAVWPAMLSLLLALCAAAWIGLILACIFALRESHSQLERARARALAIGAIALPLLPTAALVDAEASASHWISNYIVCAAVSLPAPIALGVTSYNLFDLGWDARRRIGRLLYLLASASVLAIALRFGIEPWSEQAGMPGSVRAFVLAATGLALMESVRAKLLDAIDAVVIPDARVLRVRLDAFERDVAALQEEDEIARLLTSAAGRALDASGICVALRVGTDWRVAASFGVGTSAFEARLHEARRATSARGIQHLAQTDLDPEGDVRRLIDAGAEIVAACRAGDATAALLIASSRASRKPYIGLEIELVQSLCRRAGVALENARLAGELVAAERRATTGRIAVALAHDVGKELSWIIELAQRLPEHRSDPVRHGRKSDQIAELAEDALIELKDFADQAIRGSENAELARVDEIVELASRQARRRHPRARIAVCIDPALRTARAHTALSRVLGNGLDNAILADKHSALVEVSVRGVAGHAYFQIRDKGCGMTAEIAERAFDAGFTSRDSAGGSGIGLTAAREIIDALGGTLRIESTPGAGTTLHVQVPTCGAQT